MAALAAGVLVAAFHAVGSAYYQGFRVPQGFGMEFPLPEEITHFFLFFVFGAAVTAFLTVALMATSLPRVALAILRGLATRPWLSALVAALLLTAGSLWVAAGVLGGGVFSDDEHVYRFIAQTLRTGSLTAPSPGTDLEFFAEQFVVLTERARYGQYPIGHPLLLAIGQAMSMEMAVVPLLTGALAVLILWVGLRTGPPSVAVLAVILFAASPEALLTGGSLLSQPASAACLMGALGCLCEMGRRGPRTPGWAFGAGAFLAYGIVTRPLPGTLFAATALLALVFWRRLGMGESLTVAQWLAFLIPLACGPGLLLFVNYSQSGNPFVSGYHVRYAKEWGPALVFHGTLARWTMSIVTNVTRLNFWLFGWPLSLGSCVFARRTPAARLLFAFVGADLAYRLIAPKGGIGTAGAVYLYEIVPLLCLLSADGMVRIASSEAVRRTLARFGSPATVLAAAGLSSIVVNLSLFLPFKLADAARCGEGQQVVFRLLRKQGVHDALVFHRGVVPPWTGMSWAYYPRPNGPRLDDDILFVTFQPRPEANVEFWKRRFPERRAWVFGWETGTEPFLIPLDVALSAKPSSSEAGSVPPRK